MKRTLLILLSFMGPLLSAQPFTEAPSSNPSAGVVGGAIAFSDVDGDGDPDVLITGRNISNTPISKLYLNDGAGNFTEAVGTPFEGIDGSSIAFSDVDGDGDPDVLITGSGSSARISKLYTNDGAGNFTEALGTPFEGIAGGSVAFSDVDGDGDPDVLITGSSSFGSISKLYTNVGAGNFSLSLGTPFVGVSGSSVAFSDVDGDGDPDVLISGINGLGTSISKLYINDGSGNFTDALGTPFEGAHSGSVAFSDVDGDGDPDVLITGLDGSNTPISKLYANNGTGNFTEVMGTRFEDIFWGSIAFSDVDGDNDPDVLITGRIGFGAGDYISNLYTNDGAGNFTEATGTPFEDAERGSVAFSDVDGDNDQDVLITGRNSYNPAMWKLYKNDGAGNFARAVGIFEGVWRGSVAFSDVDGDGDPDVLITGDSGLWPYISKLYTNDGTGKFTEVVGTPFKGVELSSVAFSDVDGDGDPDVLITGNNGSPISKLYTNDGAGNFTEVAGTPFEGVEYGSVAFSDVDGDGDSDVLVTGRKSSFFGIYLSKLYTNDGVGNFTEVLGTPFEAVGASSIAFSDVDVDGDPDVLITGNNGSNSISKLYTNNGSGNFTEVLGTPFVGVSSSSIAFSDVDLDGDPDVLITGSDSSARISKLYTNDGVGNFTEVVGTPFGGVALSSIAFSDVDGDGDPDVLITGQMGTGRLISKLYTNDGSGNFTELVGTPFEGLQVGSIAFSDVDGDGDQDVLITGSNSSVPISKLYINQRMISSIEDIKKGLRFDFILYPNPSEANKISVSYTSEEKGSMTVKVFDLNGRLLSVQREPSGMGEQTFSIDITSLTKGSYFIQLEDGKRKGVRKLWVQ